MKIVRIDGIWIVGMHHWARHPLPIGVRYLLNRESENPYDPKAVAIICEDSRKRQAYLKRDSARSMSHVLDSGIVIGPAYIKALRMPEVKSKRVGPQQAAKCAVKIQSEDVEKFNSLCKECGIIQYEFLN